MHHARAKKRERAIVHVQVVKRGPLAWFRDRIFDAFIGINLFGLWIYFSPLRWQWGKRLMGFFAGPFGFWKDR